MKMAKSIDEKVGLATDRVKEEGGCLGTTWNQVQVALEGAQLI